MAGIYRRFREAGYTTPKYLLPVDGAPLLTRLAAALAPQVDEVVLVANTRDDAHRDAIVDAMARAGGPAAALHFVGDTSGQAETAAIGARLTRGGGPVLFHNVDTLLFGRDLRAYAAALAHADGLIDVFPNDSAAYSYVAVDGASAPGGFARVVDIAEKRVISPFATTGLYGFASAVAYLEHAARATDRSGGEFYISDVYRHMLDHGATLLAPTDVAGHRTVVLGTPAEYEAWVAARA
jgi:dTDP-glucose pyrophosphorylase